MPLSQLLWQHVRRVQTPCQSASKTFPRKSNHLLGQAEALQNGQIWWLGWGTHCAYKHGAIDGLIRGSVDGLQQPAQPPLRPGRQRTLLLMQKPCLGVCKLLRVRSAAYGMLMMSCTTSEQH